MTPQPEDTVPQPQTAGESAQTIARLTRELEDLQADYKVLEAQRDTWKDAFEELKEKAEENVAGDEEHHERSIGALETQLGVERRAGKRQKTLLMVSATRMRSSERSFRSRRLNMRAFGLPTRRGSGLRRFIRPTSGTTGDGQQHLETRSLSAWSDSRRQSLDSL